MASIGAIFKGIAPFLSVAASFIPGVPALGIAAQALSKVVGSPVDAKGEAIAKVMTDLTMTEDGRLKLEQAEQDFQKTMAQLGYDHVEKMQELQFSDTADARKREETVRDFTPRILAYVVVISFVIVVLTTLRGWSKVDTVMAGTLVGYISAKCELVLAYYFGSSASSDRKTELLAQAPAKEPTTK
jgi:hypothetical protein